MTATAPAPAIDSVALLLSHAHVIEAEAVDRYEELAGQMEVHNNPEVAALFRKMAAVEQMHVAKVEVLAEGLELPRQAPWDYRWPDFEPPESVPVGRAHYLMTPYHALKLALEGEERAYRFFSEVSAHATDGAVRELAEDLAAEEHHHIALIAEWLARYPKPEPGWDSDLDEPVSQE